jgi:hypothetical protein
LAIFAILVADATIRIGDTRITSGNAMRFARRHRYVRDTYATPTVRLARAGPGTVAYE